MSAATADAVALAYRSGIDGGFLVALCWALYWLCWALYWLCWALWWALAWALSGALAWAYGYVY